MKNIFSNGGRLFWGTVQGSRVTLQDTMVAVHVYVTSLEQNFESPEELIGCFTAWEEDAERQSGPEPSQEKQSKVVAWLLAHERADRAGRSWLTEPSRQRFSFHVHRAQPKNFESEMTLSEGRTDIVE